MSVAFLYIFVCSWFDFFFIKKKSCLYDKYSVSSSNEFVNKISKQNIKHSNVFASLDIKSLYTHVLLKEVIENILTTINDTNIKSIIKETKITKNILRKVFSFMMKKSTNK